jgi:hypothetical protein
LNKRAENSHQPTRQRERRMKKFKSPEQAQEFLSVFDPVACHFRTMRHRISADRNRQLTKAALNFLAQDSPPDKNSVNEQLRSITNGQRVGYHLSRC